jgi:uncharacterized OB-fold protein
MAEKPLPEIDADSAPFWRGTLEKRLMLPHCRECGRAHFPPRAICPHCHADAIEWKRASGEGTIYTYTVARRAAGPAFEEDVPYVVALIDLAEGPRMMSNVIADDVGQVAIGAAVRVVFERASDAITLPKFELASE